MAFAVFLLKVLLRRWPSGKHLSMRVLAMLDFTILKYNVCGTLTSSSGLGEL